MEQDLSVIQCVKIALVIILVAVSIIFTIIVILPNIGSFFDNNPQQQYEITKTKNIMITQSNYNDIYNIVNSSTDITLQEKANFKKNYLMFGKGCIGYRVKDMLEEIEY